MLLGQLKEYLPDLFLKSSAEEREAKLRMMSAKSDGKTRRFIRGARDDCGIGARIMRNNEMSSPTLINQSRDASLKCSWAATDNLLMHHIGEPCKAAASSPLLLLKNPIRIHTCCPLGLVTRFTPVILSFLTRKEAWDLGL